MAISSTPGSSPGASLARTSTTRQRPAWRCVGWRPLLEGSVPSGGRTPNHDLSGGSAAATDDSVAGQAQRDVIALRRAQAQTAPQPPRRSAACSPSGWVAQWREDRRTMVGSGRQNLAAGPSRRPWLSNRGTVAKTASRRRPQQIDNQHPGPTVASTLLRVSSHVKVRHRQLSHRAAATKAATTAGMRTPHNSVVVND